METRRVGGDFRPAIVTVIAAVFQYYRFTGKAFVCGPAELFQPFGHGTAEFCPVDNGQRVFLF